MLEPPCWVLGMALAAGCTLPYTAWPCHPAPQLLQLLRAGTTAGCGTTTGQGPQRIKKPRFCFLPGVNPAQR